MKEPPRQEETLEASFGLSRNLRHRLAYLRNALQKSPGFLSELFIKGTGKDFVKICGHCADIRRYRHLVVVQDNNQVFLHVTCLIEPLEGKTCGESAVADYRYHLAVIASLIPCFDYT